MLALAALFVWAVLATAGMIIAHVRNEAQVDMHDTELSSYKRVGTWFEGRVAELENENRQLATQVVASGGLAHHAMPLPGPDPYVEYAYDDTGLVQERLDPRDLPSHL